MSKIVFSPKEMIAELCNNLFKMYLLVNGSDEQTATIFGAALSGAIKGIGIDNSEETIRSRLFTILQLSWRNIFLDSKYKELSIACQEDLLNNCITTETVFNALNNENPENTLRCTIVSILKKHTTWRVEEIHIASRDMTERLLISVDEAINQDNLLVLIRELERIGKIQGESAEKIDEIAKAVDTIHDENTIISKRLETSLYINREKNFYIGNGISFIYDEEPLLYSRNNYEKEKLTYEECCVMCYLIQEREHCISYEQIEQIHDYYAKAKIEPVYFFNEGEKKEISLPQNNLIEKLRRLGAFGTIVERVNDDSICLHLEGKKRLNPVNLFIMLKEYVCIDAQPEFFQDVHNFYNYLMPDLFFRLLLGDVYYSENKTEEIDCLLNRDYFIDSEYCGKIQELLVFSNDVKYLMLTKCKKIIESLSSFDLFIQAFLREYGDEPIEKSLCENGIYSFESIRSKYQYLHEDCLRNNADSNVQLFWFIGVSFLQYKMRSYSLDTSSLSGDIDARTLNYGSLIDFGLMCQKGRSLLYYDTELLIETIHESQLFKKKELTQLEEKIQSNYVHQQKGAVEALINSIRDKGQSIYIGAEKAVVLDNQFLYIENEFIIDSITIGDKCITDFQENFFEILNINPAMGTVGFLSKDTNPLIMFRIGTDRMIIRMRHLTDVIINSNRVLHLLVVSIIMQVIENDRIIVKPVVIEIAREPQEAYLDSLKKTF